MHKSAEVKNSLNHDEKLFILAEENNKSKSTENVEIKKETHELRPNSEIKTELATAMPTHNFIENSLVILTKQTLDIFLRQENPSELIALYTFYYYTAKWQATNQIKCTTGYVAKGLHWGVNKTRKVKKQLKDFGLIEDVQTRDPITKKVCGHYIRMNYIFKKETIEKTQECAKDSTDSTLTDAHSVGGENTNVLAKKATLSICYGVDERGTNALSTNNKNALSTNKNKYICAKDCASVLIEPDTESKNNKCANNKCANNKCANNKCANNKCANKNNAQSLIENKNTEPLSATKNKSLRKSKPKLAPKVLEEEFHTVWDLYPKKKDKTRAFKAFSKARKEGVPLEKICEGVQKYVQEIENTGIAHQYIKYGSTWFSNRCWEDEYDTNAKSSYNLNAYEKTMDTFENKSEDDEIIRDEKEREEEWRKDLLFEGYKEIAPGVFQSDFYQNIEFLNEESRIAYEKNGGNSP